MWLGSGGRVVGCSLVGGVDCGGVGIEDLHGVVAGGPEVRTVLDHKVRVRGHGKGIQLHGALPVRRCRCPGWRIGTFPLGAQ